MWLKFPAIQSKLNCDEKSEYGLVATLGNFDGVHLGHQTLLTAVEQEAQKRKLRSGLITFSPHPSKILRGNAPRRLSKLRQIASLARKRNINDLVVLRFTKELSQLEPEQFVDEILIARYRVRHLIIGPYARIGKNRKGTAEWILDYFNQKGLSASVVAPLSQGSERISSNLIRECLSLGDLDSVGQMLGRPFSISSKVIRGDRRGRTLGFPTANLQISDYVKPPHGVYLCQTEVGGAIYNALANFGIRPTFDGVKEVLEAHLIDYTGPSLYGKRIELALLKKIREEKRFDSKMDLQEQIKLDIEAAKEIIERKYSH